MQRSTINQSDFQQSEITEKQITLPSRQAGTFLILLILAISAFYISTFREGHDWGDDFAMYIRHSKNLVDGVEFHDTGFIINPARPIGPTTYPPVFPLMLTPIYYFFGLNLTAMKVLVTVTIMLTLIIIFFAFREYLSEKDRLALVAIIGFNPIFWTFKDQIVSDLPFTLFCFLSFCIMHMSYRKNPEGLRRFTYAILIGLSIYLAYGTRSVGLVLIPCLAAYDLIKRRRPSLMGIMAVVIAVAAVYIQNKTSHNDGGYGEQIAASLKHVPTHLWIYFKNLSNYFDNGYSKIIKLCIYSCTGLLATIGYAVRLRKEITTFEIFPVLYLGPFLILPIFPIERYLIVLVPFFFCYALIGIRSIASGKRAEIWAVSALLAIIFGSYALKYTTMDFGPFRDGIGVAESREMFDYVRKNTGPDDVFLFRKPRALALFTDRSSSSWDPAIPDSEQWTYIKRIKATYLILGLMDIEPEDYAYLQGFISRNGEKFEKCFSNKDFSIYKILQDDQSNNNNRMTQ